MAYRPIVLPPGIDTQKTKTMNSSGFSAGNLVRWREGLLQRISGWQQLFGARCAQYVRAIHAYQDLSATNTLLLGTDSGVQVYTTSSGLVSSQLGRRSATPASPMYSYTSGNSNVVINDTANGAAVNDTLRIPYALFGDADNALFTERRSGGNYADVIFANNKFVAIGRTSNSADTGGLATSTDGITWTASAIGFAANWRRITWTGSNYVAVGDNTAQIGTSPDGVTWTQRGLGNTRTPSAVGFGNSRILVWCTFGGNGFGNAAYSTDQGATWTNYDPGINNTMYDMAWNNTRFVVVGSASVVAYSTTGLAGSWTIATVPYSAVTFTSVAWSPVLSRFVVLANTGQIMTSPDGITWTAQSQVLQAGSNVRWCTNQFIATGIGRAYSSTDGITWYPMLVPNASNYLGVAASTTVNVVVGNTAGTICSARAPQILGSTAQNVTPGSYTVTAVTTNTVTISDPTNALSTNALGGFPRLYCVNAPQVTTNRTIRVWAASHGLSVGSSFSPDTTITFATNQITLQPTTVYTVTAVPNSYTFEFTISAIPATTLQEALYENLSLSPVATLQYFRGATTLPRNWFLDNLGQNGIIVPENGAIYVYTPPIPTSGFLLASNVTTGPQINTGMFVAMPQAQLLCFGSEATIGGGVQDPLLVRWSDAGSYTVWTASSTNQAGSYRLSRGSKIVGGIQAPQSALLWTDIDLWSVQYIGAPLVYSFQMIGSGCGLISAKARCVQGRNTYWMTKKGFLTFGDTGVQRMICPVYDVVFNDLDLNSVNKIHAGSNSSTNEIMWFYPSLSGGTGEIDSYVKYNTVDQCWDYGRLVRTAWYDESVWGTPIGADANWRIQQHEMGYDADGTAISGAYIETGYVTLEEGEQMFFIDEILPDMKFLGTNGSVTVTVWTKSTPNDTPIMYGPFSVTDETPRAFVRTRARFIAFRIDWVPSLGYNARLGAMRIRLAPAGRAP